MRWRAKNPTGSEEYYQEPYTVQHFTDWLLDTITMVPSFLWFIFRHFTSKKFRIDTARNYNQLMFGNIPTSQIMTFDGDRMRPLREDERTWPE